MSQVLLPSFEEIFSMESLLKSWQVFKKGKKSKVDVAEFSSNFIYNLTDLHRDLMAGYYRHGGYAYFKISDPKSRNIHKASVRDRIVHHALYRALYPYFDSQFIHDSYSCRIDKGTHRALYQFQSFGRKVSYNNTRTAWVLKCDIRKCFASVDQAILRVLLKKNISCVKTLVILDLIINSFSSGIPGKGIPLGNLTSQLFINIYLHELDYVLKYYFKIDCYIRYADDFVIFSEEKAQLEELLPKLGDFVQEDLFLELHPDKIFIQTLASGVDFLGWVHFPNHRVLRTTTKRRMFRRITECKNNEATLRSYRGLLSHGNARKLQVVVDKLASLY